MVSHLWKASSDGDVQAVLQLLSDAAGVDIELKDHTGVTPLIEAIRNGHVEVVRVLLDKGADPTNASKDGRPETYTSDPIILELLQFAVTRRGVTEIPPQHHVYAHDGNDDPEKRFYAPPPPEAYTYYPTINPALSTMNDGAAYYPPPPQPHPSDPSAGSNGIGHLPPPDIARMIPCRYFPACRYGPQCIFAHPQSPTYYQGAMPPYPPYEPMGHYAPQFYPPPPQPFQSPLSAHAMSPMSPPPPNPGMHTRSPSEVVSQPPANFTPNGLPPPVPYGPVYGHPGQGPIPIPMPPPHSQPPHPHPGPHSPPNLYSASSPVQPYPIHPEGPYPSQGPPPVTSYPDATVGGKQPENGQVENYSNHPHAAANGLGHHRRGSMRRQSFGNRVMPPCLFFPAGRCKNGDDCRFPHVLPDGAVVPTQTPFHSARGGPSRTARGLPHVNGINGTNGHRSLAEKLNNLNLRDDQRPRNGVEGSSRSHSSDAGTRPKFQANGKHHNYHAGPNGHHNHNKKNGPLTKQQSTQRVPNADEFPVLSGSTTPPKWGNGNSQNGLTAAQVLQAPPPLRKDVSKEPSTRATSPDPARGNPSKEVKAEINGHVNGHEKAAPAPVQEQPVSISPAPATPNKLPVMSFAAAAATSSSTPDIAKEVSVSA